MDSRSRVALLIDAENVAGDLADSILHEAGRHGPTTARRAYGDFAAGQGSGWLAAAAPHAIDVVQVSSPAKGKNASDIRMTIDAIELLGSDRADIFCLVSSDGDFTPLAIHLRGAGKRVVGIGGQRSSASFRESCDLFVFVGQKAMEPTKVAIVIPSPAKSATVGSKFQGLLPLVQAAIKTLGGDVDNGWVHMGRLGAALRVVEPNFTARCRGYGSLKQILRQEPALEVGRERGMFVRIRPGIAVLSA